MEIYVVSKAENCFVFLLICEASLLYVQCFRKIKTSDFFDANLRTFEAKPPYFCLKKSDVLHLPDRCISSL